MLKTEKFKGALALLAGAFLYATFALLIRELSKLFGDSAQVAARFLLAALIITVINLVAHKIVKLPRKELIKNAALGVAFTFVVLFFTISANETKVINTVVTCYAGSILASLVIGTTMLKEKLTINKLLAIAFALTGLFMYADAILALSIGIITGLASGLFDGVSNALRKTLKTSDRNVVLMYQFGIGSIFGLILLLFSGGDIIREVSLVPVLATILFAVLLLCLGNLLLYGFQHFDVNVGTIILALELVFVLALGYLFLQESPSGKELAGGALIFAASVITVLEPGEYLRTLMRRGKIVR
jgi:drug/metabolite transporter (DMT)-like permease